MSDKFVSAAKYYNRYRPQYPDELFELVKKHCDCNGTGRLLDLGCGTGFLAVPLSLCFAEVLGVDSSAEMLKEAEIFAKQQSCKNIKWLHKRAEKLGDELGYFDMVTAGRSMHWMDDTVIFPWVYDHLMRGGHFLLVGERGGFWRGVDDWNMKIAEIVKQYTGKDLLVNNKPLVLWKDMLKEYPYILIGSHELAIEREWSVNNIIGFLL